MSLISMQNDGIWCDYSLLETGNDWEISTLDVVLFENPVSYCSISGYVFFETSRYNTRPTTKNRVFEFLLEHPVLYSLH